jgi:hypothetical protein
MLVSKKELTNLKLKSIKSDDLKEVAGILGVDVRGTASNLIKKLIPAPQNKIDEFIKSKLHDDITHYVIATWYNHWTTVLIEDHIGQHSKIIPTLKNNFGVDIFFDNQPFDLKITYLPKDFTLEQVLKNPKDLIIWLYENQGAQRFGSDNRFFVVLASKNNLEESWKLKRDFDFVFSEIDKFFNSASVSTKDEIVFSFKKKTYTTTSKILIITK